MALARSRRDSGIELLAGLRRRAVDADPRHHLPALGVRGRAVLPVAGSHRQGHRARRASTRRSPQLTELLSLEKTGKTDLEEQIAQLARDPLRRPRASATACAASSPAAERRAQQGRDRQAHGRSSTSRSRLTARAVAQVELLNQQIAALRRQLAALEERARSLREEGQGIADAHRRSRPAAQRGAGAARAGTLALPLGFLRPAARNPRQPPRHPHRRRPLRVPVGSVLRRRPGGAAAGRPRRARQARDRAARARQADPAGDRLGAARRRPHRRAADVGSSQFKSNWELSAARAISVVQYLISKGVSPQRLVAAGFGEFQPIDPGNTEEAYQPQPPHRAEADRAVGCAGIEFDM